MIRADRNFAGAEPSLDLKGTDTVVKIIEISAAGWMPECHGKMGLTTFLSYGPKLWFRDGRQNASPFHLVPFHVGAVLTRNIEYTPATHIPSLPTQTEHSVGEDRGFGGRT